MSPSTASLASPLSPLQIARRQRELNKPAAIPCYFVVMIDYGRRGREAIVDPEITRREVIDRIVSGEYRDVVFIHEIADGCAVDVTLELQVEASVIAEAA
jgi:hypothetical protein